MVILRYIWSFLSGIVASVIAYGSGYLAGWRRKQVADLKEEIKAHETRQKVEDDIRSLPFDERRMRLGNKWAMRGMEGNIPDSE